MSDVLWSYVTECQNHIILYGFNTVPFECIVIQILVISLCCPEIFMT